MALRVLRHEFESGTDRQQEYYDASVAWTLSLKKRHDPHDKLSILELDTDKYPFQDISKPAFLPAYRPSQEEIIAAGGETALQEQFLDRFRFLGGMVVGLDKFDRLSDDFARTARPMWERQQTGSNTCDLIFHPNLMALPLYMFANCYGLSRADCFKDPKFVEEFGKFNLFDFTEQSFSMINPALSVAAYDGVPVPELMSWPGNVVMIVPPTQGSHVYSRELRRQINGAVGTSLDEKLEELSSKSRGGHLVIDPTGSTAEVEHSGESITGLNRKRINPLAAKLVENRFSYVRPSTMFWDDDPKQAKWFVGEPREVSPDDHGVEPTPFNQTVAELDQETAKLAGVDKVKVVSQKIGNAALGSA